MALEIQLIHMYEYDQKKYSACVILLKKGFTVMNTFIFKNYF